MSAHVPALGLSSGKTLRTRRCKNGKARESKSFRQETKEREKYTRSLRDHRHKQQERASQFRAQNKPVACILPRILFALLALAGIRDYSRFIRTCKLIPLCGGFTCIEDEGSSR